MKQIDFWFDFVSPYAYLAFEHLPQALEGMSYEVRYRPIEIVALFRHHGHTPPVAVASKRDWICRHVGWMAQQLNVLLQMPKQFPFNSMPLLRLAYACARHGTPNRYVCEVIFHHVWHGGLAADDPARVQVLMNTLQPDQDPSSDVVQAAVRAQTDAAIAAGAFGTPSFELDKRLFWGLDALPMLRAQLQGDAQLEAAWALPNFLNKAPS